MRTRFCSPAVLTVAALLCAPEGGRSQPADNPGRTIVTSVEGRQLPWAMQARYPWAGGNVYQLDRMIRTGKLDVLEEIMQSVKAAAAQKDAVLVHLDDLREYAKRRLSVPTELVIMFSPENLADLFRKDPQSAWGNIARLMVEPRYPAKSDIDALVAEKPEPTAGFASFRAIFRVVTPAGEKLARVIHLVDLKSNGMHVFTLATSAPQLDDRYDEFVGMLKTVRYNLPESRR